MSRFSGEHRPIGAPTLHEPFLERASTADGTSGGHALGAFLTLRLVDQFAHGADAPADAVAYQVDSTHDYLRNLRPQTIEVGHLTEIARTARAAHERGTVRLLWPALLAFAYWLEQEHRLEEALDVVDTAARMSDGRDAEEEVAGALQRARLVRKLSRYAEATEGYRLAGDMARRLGDSHSELLARIGRGITLQKVGNLPEAVQLLQGVIFDAGAAGDDDAEARARHDLANAYLLMGRAAAAVPEGFRAFELYSTEAQRIRALGDLGMAFKSLGNHPAAEDAFAIVLNSPACSLEIRINAMLELLEVAAQTGDRVSFERWRRQLEGLTDTLRPDAQVDFCLKAGAGWALFGHTERARELLGTALEMAEAHGLNTYLFRAEQELDALAARGRARSIQETGLDDGVAHDVKAREVAGRLHAMRAGA